jgi:methylthioribose-1-phosphate isomerase
LSLDYLREQVVGLRQKAEQATGIYAEAKQQAALDRYCEKALAAFDVTAGNLVTGFITERGVMRAPYLESLKHF